MELKRLIVEENKSLTEKGKLILEKSIMFYHLNLLLIKGNL